MLFYVIVADDSFQLLDDTSPFADRIYTVSLDNSPNQITLNCKYCAKSRVGNR